MRGIANYSVTKSTERIQLQRPTIVYKKQLAKRLRTLANEEYQLMVRMKMLANALQKPAFTAVIENADYCSDKIMNTLNHHAYYINLLEEDNTTIPAIVKPCELSEYAGWVDRVKEIIFYHLQIKEKIVDIFVTFNEEEFPEAFHFLKEQMALHEDQMWHMRNLIEG